MADINGSNGWDTYQKLVLSKLDDLQSGVDKTNEHFWAHVKESNEKFVAIDKDKAVQEALAAGHAKFWATVGAGVSIILGILGDWILFGRGK